MMRKGWKTIGTILLICMLFVSLIPANLYAEDAAAENDENAAIETIVAEDTTEATTEVVAATEEATTEAVAQEAEVSSEENEAATDEGAFATTAYRLGQTGPTSCSEESVAATPARVKKAKKAAPKPGIYIKKKKITIKKGTKKKIKFTVKNTSKKNIKWTSSDKSVAKVNSKGVVKVLSGGKCVITARVKGTNIQDSIIVKGKDYYIIRVRTTGYCNCSSCAGPWAGCRTASGRYPRANHTIAVDRRLIKLGTKVKIGRITYVAEDVGSAIRGRRIDIYYSSHSRASRHGVRWQTAKVYF